MTSPADLEPIYYSVNDAARVTSLSVGTIRRLIRYGDLPSIKVRGRVLVPVEAVRNLGVDR